MPLIQPDFSDILEKLPEGVYKAHIVDVEEKTSQTGNPYVKWQLTVYDAPDARCNGKAVWTNTPTSGKGAFRLQQLYTAAMGKKLEGAFDSIELMGKSVLITVVNEQDRRTGEPTGYSEVKLIKALQ